MTQQTRRQFFKTVAATAAGVVAVGVAPRVVAKEPEVGVGNRAKHLVFGDPGVGKSFAWKTYYADHNDNIDATLLAKLDKAVKNHKFIPPITQ